VEAPERDARVPDPGVPVVPVALAAGRLGQRRGERRHHPSRWLVRESLQGERRALEEPAQRMVGEGSPLEPPAPDVLRRPDQPVRSLGRLGADQLLAPGQAGEQTLPGAHRSRPANDGAVHLEGDVAAQAHRLPSSARVRGQALLVHERPARLLGRVVERGLADDLDLHLPVDALDGSDEHVVRVARPQRPPGDIRFVIAVRGREHEGVMDHAPSRLRHPRRLEHVGSGDVTPRRRRPEPLRTHAVGARATVEERGEDRRRVEAGKAEPFDRPVGSHQGARMAIGEESVVADAVELWDGGAGAARRGLLRSRHLAPERYRSRSATKPRSAGAVRLDPRSCR
jgi:hypothetical protein